MESAITRPRLVLGAAALLCLLVPIAAAGAAGGSGDPKGTASASVKKQVKKLKKQVKKLKAQVEGVSKQPGLPGPQGEKGDKGDPGSLTGAAGGDLTGNYPNPSIAGLAVTTPKLAGGAVNGAKVQNGSLGVTDLSSSIPAARVLDDAEPTEHSTTETLNFEAEFYDTANMHSNVSNPSRLTAPVDGIYAVTAQIEWETNGTGQRFVALMRNGNTEIASESVNAVNSSPTIQEVTTQVRLVAGEFVDVDVFQTSGGPLGTGQFQQSTPVFSMTWLAPGP